MSPAAALRIWRRRAGAAYGLPLADDPSSRFLGWLTALMSFLAVLALAGAMALADMADRWTSGLAGGLTVQVAALLPPAAAGGAIAAPVSLTERAERALAVVRATPGVRAATLLDRAAAARLLAPWLGPDVAADDLLPTPALIDAVVGGPVDVAGLRAALAAVVPGVSVDDHGLWLADLSALAGAVQGAALTVVGLIAGAGALAVVFSVRAGLAIHQGVVRLLHLMGAADDYISRQFEWHVGFRALRGAAIGAAAAAGLLVLLGAVAGDLRASLLPSLHFGVGQWAVLLLAPLLFTPLAAAVARWTVRRSLERLP